MTLKESKNVLQFMCYGAPYSGSFIKSLLRLETTLESEGLESVYVFHSDISKRDWIQELVKQGKKIYFLSGKFSKDIFTVRNIIVKHNIKYIHAHFAGVKYFLLFNMIRPIYWKQLFVIRHLRNHDKPRGIVSERLRKILNHVDLYIGCSESVAIEYRKNFNHKKEKVTFATNAIDFTRLEHFEDLLRSDYQIKPTAKIFLMFGFDYFRKGVDVVLEAVNNLVQQGEDVYLLLSLSSNRASIEAKIKERFHELPEWLKIMDPRDDIASYYKLSDYFISASREEGFCNALVEAAYCERPIITSNIPGPQSLNIPHTHMFESGNVAELQKTMLSLIKLSDDQKNKIVTDQKEYALKNFDLNQWANQISDIYKNLKDKDYHKNHSRGA